VLAVLGLMALFSLLAEAALGTNELSRFDRRVADTLHAHAVRSPVARRFFMAVTTLGDFEVLLGVGLGMLVLLVCRRYFRMATAWIITLLGAAILNVILKDMIGRARPTFVDPIIVPGGLSFPSGHSMNGMVGYGMLAYLLTLIARKRWQRRAVVAVLAVLVISIGFSRMYLGAHWFSDVIGGWSMAAVWLTLCIGVCESVRRRLLERGES